MKINNDIPSPLNRGVELDRLCRRYVAGELGSDELLRSVHGIAKRDH
ncbi:hypothetical protein [Mycetocola reblochoni]|uniref:Antitoxin VbhA domain-containing protein n=1 Tax=Mycetocola reblochoni REB411 TaxID=1255698 RepID=A0A1R4IWE0_9MICO|nr:hypothetical protein [Mycetocola reblochoni]SJN24018.1 hypothetical protein FM119_03955 [Mycetocola reblochoni REB411]